RAAMLAVGMEKGGHASLLRRLRVARPIELCPRRFDRVNRDAAGNDLLAGCKRIADPSEMQHRQSAPLRGRAHHADLDVPNLDRYAGLGGEILKSHRHDALARRAAMLDPRYDLLADITAFLEVDTVELIHVGLVREGVVVLEIQPAARRAERDAMRLV